MSECENESGANQSGAIAAPLDNLDVTIGEDGQLYVVKNIPDNIELLNLLKSLSGGIFYAEFLKFGITIDSLKYFKSHHLSEICPKEYYGQRVIFENQLIIWQQGQVELAPTVGNTSSIERWLENSNFSASNSSCDDLLNIETLVSEKGEIISNFYVLNKGLNKKYRQVLADLIIQEIIKKKITGTPKYNNCNNFKHLKH